MGWRDVPASEETKEQTAKVAFVAVFGLLGGWAGVVIAAMAVGIDRAWNGDAGRAVEAASGRQAQADHRRWLAWDAAARAAYRQARRAWWDAGGDPDSRPARPSRAARAGRWVQRQRRRNAVVWDDFKTGFKAAWPVAKDEMARGGSFRAIVRARPDHPDADRLDWSGIKEPAAPTAEPTARPAVREAENENKEDISVSDSAGQRSPMDLINGDPILRFIHDEARRGDRPASPPAATPKTIEGDTVTAPTTAAAGRQGDTNLDVATHALADVSRHLGSTDQYLDALNKERERLAKEIAAAVDHATSTGAPQATRDGLDAAMAALRQMERHIAAFSTSVAQTDEQVGAAKGGLDQAAGVKDSADQIGMRGGFVDTATA